MCTMKTDMGGAAAVLGAFRTYVLSSKMSPKKQPISFYGLLCIADNAIGPLSQRHDDV